MEWISGGEGRMMMEGERQAWAGRIVSRKTSRGGGGGGYTRPYRRIFYEQRTCLRAC